MRRRRKEEAVKNFSLTSLLLAIITFAAALYLTFWMGQCLSLLTYHTKLHQAENIK